MFPAVLKLDASGKGKVDLAFASRLIIFFVFLVPGPYLDIGKNGWAHFFRFLTLKAGNRLTSVSGYWDEINYPDMQNPRPF